MHPELFHIGGFTVPTYGAVYAFSIMLSILLSFRWARKEGISEERYLGAMLLAIVGILVMSKVFHIVISWSWYMEHPERFLNLRTGHVFYGGYIGSITFPLIYLRLIREPILPILDTAATYMPLGLAIHRAFGCLNAGCCYGLPTNLPWGITFPDGAPAFNRYGAVAVHPTQLYEALFALAMFASLLFWRKYYRKVSGELFSLQVALYALGRFFIEFVRGDTSRGFFGPLSTSQWVSIAMLGLVACLLVSILRRRNELGGEDDVTA